MTGLPHDKRLDGPPEGKEVVLVFEVRVTVERMDPDDDGGRTMERDLQRVLDRHFDHEAGVEHMDTEPTP